MSAPFYQTFAISSTDASHSGIGTATPIDYNLGNIHKNSVIIVNVTVGVSAVDEINDQRPERELISPVSHEEPIGVSD
jgi:hypothetical protein